VKMMIDVVILGEIKFNNILFDDIVL